jgi:hypothetical protein
VAPGKVVHMLKLLLKIFPQPTPEEQRLLDLQRLQDELLAQASSPAERDEIHAIFRRAA